MSKDPPPKPPTSSGKTLHGMGDGAPQTAEKYLPKRSPNCSLCGASIRWARTGSGGWIALDLRRVPGGNLEVHKGFVVGVKPNESRHAYLTHATTCAERKDAALFGRKLRRKPPPRRATKPSFSHDIDSRLPTKVFAKPYQSFGHKRTPLPQSVPDETVGKTASHKTPRSLNDVQRYLASYGHSTSHSPLLVAAIRYLWNEMLILQKDMDRMGEAVDSLNERLAKLSNPPEVAEEWHDNDESQD